MFLSPASVQDPTVFRLTCPLYTQGSVSLGDGRTEGGTDDFCHQVDICLP